MGFWNKKKGIVWVRPWGYEWLTKFQFSQTMVMGQEIIDVQGLEKGVMDWVYRELKGRLSLVEIVIANEGVFSKEVTELNKQDEFWLEVPIEPAKQARLSVKGDKTWKLFVTNSEIYAILERALAANKIKVLRVVPEEVKQLTKIDFRQAETLVLSPTVSKAKSKSGLVFLIIILVVVLGIMVFMITKSRDLTKKSVKITVAPTPVVIMTPIPTTTAVETVEIDKQTLKIKVLNGSGVAGKAGVMKEFLTSLGYENVETGNAARDDYQTTIVMIKEGNVAVGEVIGADLRSKYENIASPEASLTTDSDVDVEIIIGGK